MLNWLKSFNQHFIADCRLWYKKWSTWLACLWGIVGVVFWNIPTWLPELLDALPSETRAWLSPVILGVMAGVPILIANLKQRKLEEATKQLVEGKKDA